MKLLNLYLTGLVSVAFTACGGGGGGGGGDSTSSNALNYKTSISLGDDISNLGTYNVCVDLNKDFTCDNVGTKKIVSNVVSKKELTTTLTGSTYTFVSQNPLIQNSNLLAVLKERNITFVTKAAGNNKEAKISIKSTLQVASMQGGLSQKAASAKIDAYYTNLKLDSDNKDLYTRNILKVFEKVNDFNQLYYFANSLNSSIYSNSFNVEKETSSLKTTTKKVLNDTGLLKYFNGSSMLDKEPNTFPGQDASFGSNVMKFIKLNNLGAALADDASEYSCLKDETSGLIWEIKDDTTTSPRYKFSKFTADIEGFSSVHTKELEATTCNNQGTELVDCKTSTYINYMNKINYCGKNDWRLPTAMEQINLLDLSITQKVTKDGSNDHYYYRMDKNLFKDMFTTYAQVDATSTSDMSYWSSTFFNNNYEIAHHTVSVMGGNSSYLYSSSVCQKDDTSCDYPTVLPLRLVSQSK